MSRARTAVATAPTAPTSDPVQPGSLAAQWFRIVAGLHVDWLRRPGVAGDELARLLGDDDAPAAQHAWEAADPERSARRAAAEAMRATVLEGRAGRLAATFALERGEQDLLLATLAVYAEPDLGRLCAWLNGHAGATWVGGALTARLRCADHHDEPGPGSALRRWRLLVAIDVPVGLPAGWRLDEPVARWLLGHDELDPALIPYLRPIAADTPPEGWSLAPLAQTLSQRLPAATATLITGELGSGRVAAAAMLAGHLGLPCWEVVAGPTDLPWRELWLRANRFAFLSGSALAWRARVQPVPEDLPAFPLRFLVSEDSTPIWPVDAVLALGRLDAEDRARIWAQHLPTLSDWPMEARAELLAEPVGYGELVRVAATVPTGLIQARQRLAELRHADAGGLAVAMPCPFTWDDLVLPAPLLQRLRDLAQEIHHQEDFFAQTEPARLFPRGRGLHALLGGPPGTGKTMTALVLAWDAGRPLWRVDLAQVADKYVGESEKRLARIFAAARRAGAMLLFDEADALFARRGEVREARDRWANLEAAYLLQALEDHPGPVVLATNRAEDIDSAFARRLRCVLSFPAPDPALRLIVWRRLVKALAGSEIAARLDADLDHLSRALSLTPAQIKQAVLSACLAARRHAGGLCLEDLLTGVERELLKAGTAFSARDRERLGGVA